MLNCDEALELISARVDGALTQEESRLLDQHLEQCPACRALLEDFQAMEGVFPTLAPQPPAELTETVMARVRASKLTPFQGKRRQWRWRSLASLAAVLVLVVVGGNALRQWQTVGGGLSAGSAAMPPAAGADGSSAVTRDIPASGDGAEPAAGGAEEPAVPKEAGMEPETAQDEASGETASTPEENYGANSALPAQTQSPQAEAGQPQVLTVAPGQAEGDASASSGELTEERALLRLAAWLGWDTENLTVDDAGTLAGPTAEDGTTAALTCIGPDEATGGWLCQLEQTTPGPDGTASCTTYTVLPDGSILPPEEVS